MADDKKDKGYTYPEFSGQSNDEFYDTTGWQVKEKEMKNLKERMDAFEKKGGKKTETLEHNVNQEVYHDLYKKELHKKYNTQAEKEKREAIEKAQDEAEHQEIERMKRRGTVNKQKFDEKHPVIGKIRDKIEDERDLITESEPGKYIKEKIDDRKDRNLIKHGVPLSDIREYNELAKKYQVYIDNYDNEGAKEIKNKLREKEREINQKVQEDKTQKMKDEIEQKKWERILNPRASTTTKKENIPKEFDYRNQMKLVKGIGYHPSRDSVSFTNSVGFPRPNVSVPSFAGYGNMSFDNRANMEAFARQRIIDRRQVVLNEQAMRRAEAVRKDQELQNTFMRTDKLHTMITGEGTLPQARLHNMPTAMTHKNKNLSPTAKMGMVALAMPKINLSLTSKNRVPLSNNNKGGVITPPIKNKLNTTQRIAAGIGNLVSPAKSTTLVHRQKVFGAPTCKMCDINANIKSLSGSHTGRSFGVNTKTPSSRFDAFGIKMPNIDLSSVVGKKKKKAKS